MTRSRALALATALALAMVAATLAASCLVSNKTGDFECSSTSDCSDARICEGGYCIVDNRPPDVMPCPSPCTSCSFVEMTCDIVCDDAQSCSNVTCPAGFDCEVDCTANNACDTVDCSQATSCDIECRGTDACGDVICGTGNCTVVCDANGVNEACGAVDCAQSCDCDVDCDAGEDCTSASCPTSGADCTDGSGAGCDSGQLGCSTCP